MVFPNRFIRVVASGPTQDGGEIWSCSWSMADPNVDNDAEQIDPDPIGQAVEKWFKDPNASISSYAKLDRVKVNLVDQNGRYVSSGATEEYELPIQARGGSANGLQWPFQVSLAVTMRSARRRGPGSVGRFYPPLTSSPIGGDGRIGASEARRMADAAASLLADMTAGAGGPLTGRGPLQVVNASAVGAGRFDPVTSVQVGRVPDTIRRRRSALAEDYQSATVSPIPPAQ